MRRYARLLLCGLVVWSVWLAVPARAADEAVVRASRLYEAGERAHGKGDYDTAARRFLEADRLVPAPAALEAALAAALLADEPVLGMQIFEQADRARDDPRLATMATRVREKHGAKAGRLAIRCDPCRVAIDGAPVVAGVAHWVVAGVHELSIDVGGNHEAREVEVRAGATVEIVPLGGPTREPPAPPPEPAGGGHSGVTAPESDGLSPPWFWVGTGLTAAAGIGAAISGVDTLQQHRDFERAPTHQAAEDGKAAQTRTNVLIGVGAGLGVTTLLLGVFAVDWSDDDDAEDAEDANRGRPGARWLIGPGGLTLLGRF